MGQVTTMLATTIRTRVGIASIFNPQATAVPSIFNDDFAPQRGHCADDAPDPVNAHCSLPPLQAGTEQTSELTQTGT